MLYNRMQSKVPRILPTYTSSKKCWPRYILEYATRNANRKSSMPQKAFFAGSKMLIKVKQAKAPAVCPEGKESCWCKFKPSIR